MEQTENQSDEESSEIITEETTEDPSDEPADDTEDAEIPDEALAVLKTSVRGGLTVISTGKGEAVSNKQVDYTQSTTLLGADASYDATYKLTFNLTTVDPKAELSAKSITVNKNYEAIGQRNNWVSLTLNDGEKIVKCDVVDSNTGAKKDIIDLIVGGIGDNVDSTYVSIQASINADDLSKVAKGNYKAISKVKLPIYVNLFGQSGDSYNTVKVVVTVNIKN